MTILLFLSVTWIAVRHTESVTCTAWTYFDKECYSESQKVFSAMSLSFLAYGCERCDLPSGTVSEILDTENMDIITENIDISRANPSDPTTAQIDSSAFIRQAVGDYRFITDMKDDKSGFYGAAFADDDRKTVWMCYSGSVSFTDAVQALLLVIGSVLSK